MRHKKKSLFIILALLHFNLAAVSQSQAAMDLCAKGDAAIVNDDYKTAIDNYNKALKVYPSYAIVYLHRGECYSATGKFELAINDFSKAIALGTDPYYIYAYRGDAYTKIGKYDLALADYNKSLEENEYESMTYASRAELYRRLKQYDLAMADCQKAISNEEYHGSIYAAAVYSAMRKYDLAISTVSVAIKSSSINLYAFNDRGHYYSKKGVYDSAIIDFNKAISLNPQSPIPYRGRGTTYYSMGEYGKSITDLKKAISLNKAYDYAYLNLIFPLTRLHLFNEASDNYKRYHLLKSEDSLDFPGWAYVRYYLNAACVSAPQNKFDKALEEIKMAELNWIQQEEDKNATESSYYSSILVLKGYLLEKLNRHAEARDAYKQALVIKARQPDIEKALAAVEKKFLQIADEDKTSPTIELISPQPTRSFDIESDNPKTQIVGKAKDNSGIASVKINGKSIDKVEEDGLFISDLILESGANKIDITVMDKKGNTASRSFIINGATVAKKTEKKVEIPTFINQQPKYYAILIAENDYQDPGMKDLENPIKDARGLKEILETQYTFNKENIDTVYNKSRDEIMEAIIQRCNTLTENDNLIIFYAGHGWGKVDQIGNVDGYLIPVSAKKKVLSTYISTNDIITSLKSSRAKHILVIADACFSGALTRGIGDDAGKDIQKQYRVPSRKVMASGNMEEVPDNSIFIFYLKQNLKANTEKYLTAMDLFNGFRKAVSNNSDTSPQYGAIKGIGDEGGEFIFIKK